jgi:hypothetical protein
VAAHLISLGLAVDRSGNIPCEGSAARADPGPAGKVGVRIDGAELGVSRPWHSVVCTRRLYVLVLVSRGPRRAWW